MSMEQKKQEVLSEMRKELAKQGVLIEESDIHTKEVGKMWFLWIEQENGLNTRDDKMHVNLDELAGGVNYHITISYHMNKWAGIFRHQKKDPKP